MTNPNNWPEAKKIQFLDIIMSKVFTGQRAGFYAPLMVSLENKFVDDIPTAATDFISLYFNLDFLYAQKGELKSSVFMHELLHVGYMHGHRRGNRDPKRWNYACDYKINLDLKDMGYPIGTGWLLDEQYRGLSEEQIYALLPEELKIPNPLGQDIQNVPESLKQKSINNVLNAIQQAKMCKEAGSVPGGIEEYINGLLTPIVPWEKTLQKFFTDLIGVKTTWRRPSRRYSSVYMPTRKKDIGRLQCINFYRDTSGSIDTFINRRISSEMYYIWNTFKPKEMNIIQFDCSIQKETKITERESFNDFKVKGRGGTSLVCVRDHILKHEPSVAVIFSDMECDPMYQKDINIPIVWIRVGTNGHTPSFGEVVTIPANLGRNDDH